MHNHQSKGFTLIELLVVIAIISVLSTITVVAINPAQRLMEARDAARKLAIGQIANALEAYYTAHGEYPHPCDRTDSQGGCASASNWRNAAVLDTEEWLKRIPEDPINNRFSSVWQGYGNFSYFIVSENAGGGTAGEYFMVGAFLENTDDPATIGNLSTRPHWPNCSSDIGFASNIYMIRSYHCPNDPPGAH